MEAQRIRVRLPISEDKAVSPQEKCACVALDDETCARMRDRVDIDDDDNRRKCECPCHDEILGRYDDELEDAP